MTDKITLLFVEHTGHVLAAVTRNADPTGPISAGELAAGGLLVRGFSPQAQFEVSSEQLAVLTVDLDPVVLLQPRTYRVEQAQAVPLPSTLVTDLTVKLTATNVEVSLTGSAPEETRVWFQIEGGHLTSPLVAYGVIPTGMQKVTLPIEALGPGTYNVLVLVVDYPPFMHSQPV
jgi:hypothetical protein